MASKNQSAVQPEESQSLTEIGELRRVKKVSFPIFAGVCAENGWKPGKMVTEAEFMEAVSRFTGAAMDGQARAKAKGGKA